MSYKDILIHVDDGKACAERIRVAVELALRFDAHLTGLYVDPGVRIPVLMDGPVAPELVERLEEERARVMNRAEALFREVAGGCGLKSEWRSARGEMLSTLNVHARYTDLVVTGQEDVEDGAAAPGVPDSTAMGAGRPVLVVPYIGVKSPPGERVMVAWNGGREAVRAVNDALPLLQGAKTVDVVSINPQRVSAGDLPGADIALHLARHGVKAEARQVIAGDVEVGDVLLSHASDASIDLIVMGAYGHSRLREVVLGGATRHLLEHMTVPVLMSH